MQSPGWAGWSSGICFLLPFMGASCEQQHGGRLSCSCSCSSSLSLIEQSGVYLEGYYGQSGALWRGSSRRHSQFELGKTPQPLSYTQVWECAAFLNSLVLHPSLELH